MTNSTFVIMKRVNGTREIEDFIGPVTTHELAQLFDDDTAELEIVDENLFRVVHPEEHKLLYINNPIDCILAWFESLFDYKRPMTTDDNFIFSNDFVLRACCNEITISFYVSCCPVTAALVMNQLRSKVHPSVIINVDAEPLNTITPHTLCEN